MFACKYVSKVLHLPEFTFASEAEWDNSRVKLVASFANIKASEEDLV